MAELRAHISLLRARVAVAVLVTVGAIALWAGQAEAAASLTVTPLTFNIVGLDSNDVTTGPNSFPLGARVCNTGDAAATNLSVDFAWTGAPNAYINLSGPGSLAEDSLAAEKCFDAYFTVVVTRDEAAYDTARAFTIVASADGGLTASSPSPREIYVEHLVSQNRNTIASVGGPSTVYVGSSVQFTLDGATATQGYEQLESYLDMNPSIFRVRSVTATYTAPSGATNDKPWADACRFDFDPTSPNYRSCVGPELYAGGKAGGGVTMTYNVDVVGAGTTTVGAVIYDFSGSSYHYNSDFGAVAASLTVVAAPEPPPTTTTTTEPTTTTTTVPVTTTTTMAVPPTTTTTTVPVTTTTTMAVPPTTTTTSTPATTTTTMAVPPTTTTTPATTTTTSPAPLPDARTFVINTGGAPGPVVHPDDDNATYSFITGTLPPGLSLRPDGSFAGTASQVGTFEFDASVCQRNGECTVRHVRVEVLSAGAAAPVQASALAGTGGHIALLAAAGALLLALGGLVRRVAAS